MKPKKIVKIPSGTEGFAEDKDAARRLRMKEIIPALETGDAIALDFADIAVATQSFVHALIGEALRRYGEAVLDRIEFRNCSKQLKSIIPLVVDYSLGGFEPPAEITSTRPSARRK